MDSLKTFPREALRALLPLAILGAGVVGFAAISDRQQPPARQETEELVPLVETVSVEPNTAGLQINVDGLVVPFREVTLSAEVAGRVTRKSPQCDAGRYVTQGTLLFEIDPRNYELEVARLELELAQADVNLRELDVELANTTAQLELVSEQLELEKRQVARIERVHQRQAASESDLDDARRAELTVRTNRQTLQSQLDLLQTRRARLEQAQDLVAARLEEAQLNLARTKVVAPLDGVIVNDHVEQDSYVQPGTQLVTIDDTSAVEVQCNLRVEELRWIWQQETFTSIDTAATAESDYRLPQVPARVTYRLGDRQFHWEGTLSHYDGSGLDERTRTVPCRIRIPNPRVAAVTADAQFQSAGPPALLRGMYVGVQLETRPPQPLLRVPERAIRPGNVVWRVVGDHLEVERVKVARLIGDMALLEPTAEGLQLDDRIIISPLASAIEGMAVREQAAP